MSVEKVLFVDDNRDIAECLAALAQEALEYTTQYVFHTPHAVAQADNFDVIVCDLEMPCGGARNLLASGISTPVVVHSSRFPNAQLEAEMMGMGALMCRPKDTTCAYLNRLLSEASELIGSST